VLPCLSDLGFGRRCHSSSIRAPTIAQHRVLKHHRPPGWYGYNGFDRKNRSRVPWNPIDMDDYSVLDKLGSGGCGTVFRARQRSLGRDVALKFLHFPDNDADDTGRQRLKRELRIAGKLSHPNLVRVYDGDAAASMPYIVMELVRGKTLGQILEMVSPLPLPLALAIGSRMADGTSYLHAHQVLHRDIKPSNLMISDEGVAKLLDFGTARDWKATRITEAGDVVGTITHLAPELILGKSPTPASDLWSIGCVLYEMVTGRQILDATYASQWASDVLEREIVPPDVVADAIPGSISSLIMELLQKNVSQRLSSAKRLSERLDEELAVHYRSSWDSYLAPGILDSFCKDARPPLPNTAPDVPQTGRPSNPPTFSNITRALRQSVPWTVCLLGISLFIWFGFTGRRRAIPRQPLPIEKAVPPRASGVPTIAVSHDVPYSVRGQQYAAYLPSLSAGGSRASGAVTSLQAITRPFDLGPRPETWHFWIRIGQWARQGGSLPLSTTASSAVPGLDGVDESLDTIYMLKHAVDNPIKLTSVVIQLAETSGQWGRGWLLLGRILELDGFYQQAVKAYEEGLSRLPGENLSAGLWGPWVLGSLPAFQWTALARALLTVKGHDLVEEWPRWTRAVRPDHGPARTALRTALSEELDEERASRPAPLQHLMEQIGLQVRQRPNHLRNPGFESPPSDSDWRMDARHYVLYQSGAFEGKYFLAANNFGEDRKRTLPGILQAVNPRPPVSSRLEFDISLRQYSPPPSAAYCKAVIELREIPDPGGRASRSNVTVNLTNQWQRARVNYTKRFHDTEIMAAVHWDQEAASDVHLDDAHLHISRPPRQRSTAQRR
jgi:serine/threonine protein kinase